jgi:chromate transporter
MIQAELFARFLLISLVAFGGGQAALPLIERVAVQDAGWITSATFGSAVAFGYLTPGPVLITATFVGYQVAGLSGALAATIGVFLAPWTLAATAAHQVKRLAQDRRLRAFGAGAAPAVIGTLGVTVLSISREAFVAWPYLVLGAAVFALATWTRMHPVALLGIGGILGWLLGFA